MCPFTEIKVSFDDNGGDNDFKNNSPRSWESSCYIAIQSHSIPLPVRVLKTNTECCDVIRLS